MNKEFVLKTAEHMETLPAEKFDMGLFFCGTAACIAGHMCLLDGWERSNDQFSQLVTKGKEMAHPESVATELAGFTSMQAAGLFYDMSLSTPQEAAARLRQLVEAEA